MNVGFINIYKLLYIFCKIKKKQVKTIKETSIILNLFKQYLKSYLIFLKTKKIACRYY